MTVNGAATASMVGPEPGQGERVRRLVGRIAARQSCLRALLRAQRDDLGELLELTGIDDGGALVHFDCIDHATLDLLYYASGGEHDRHASD